MFGGAYDDAPADERPKYGSLNYRRRPAGGSVRFGSSHLRLARHVLARTTFCYPDSSTEPDAVGTADHLRLVELALADDGPDPLDDHVEAHVHGPLRLATDVAELVLDPSFAGTGVEAAAAALPFPYRFHHGFRLSIGDLRRLGPGFRGPDVAEAGVGIAEEGAIDARVIGAAVARGSHDPQVLKRVWHCTARFGGPGGHEARR